MVCITDREQEVTVEFGVRVYWDVESVKRFTLTALVTANTDSMITEMQPGMK